MGVDGVFNERPVQHETRQRVEEDRRDPRYGFGRGAAFTPPDSAVEVPKAGAPLLGDDELRLSPEEPTNPFQALINHRRRRRPEDPTEWHE